MLLHRYIEMAAARPSDIQKQWFHGTPSQEAADDIMQNGIQPPDLTNRFGFFRPVEGKVYITKQLGYALIYAAGANIIGTETDYIDNLIKEHGQYGHVFVIDGQELKDIQPDEDNLGELAYFVINNQTPQSNSDVEYDLKDINELSWLKKLAYRVLSNEHIDDEDDDSYGVDLYTATKRYDDFAHLAQAGKVLMPHLTDEQKLQLIDIGTHVAHHGPLTPSEIWRFDRKLISKIHKTGKNFFKLAEKIK